MNKTMKFSLTALAVSFAFLLLVFAARAQTIGPPPPGAGTAADVTVGTTTITGGTNTRVLYDNAGLLGEYTITGTGSVAMSASPTFTGTVQASAATLAGVFTSALNGAASAPAVALTGTWFAAGSATTTKPLLLVEPSGTTSTGWGTSGTGLGINSASAFTGNFFDFQINGTSKYKGDYTGILTVGSGTGAATLNLNSNNAGKVIFSTNNNEQFALTVGDVVAISLLNTSGGFHLGSSSPLRLGSGTSASNTTDAIMSRSGTNFSLGAGLIAAASMTATTLQLTAIASDSGFVDNTVCVSGGGVLLKGSGVAGICLGTSSMRFKERIHPSEDGLAQVLALEPKNFFYRKGWGDDGRREMTGFMAEDVINVIPKVVGLSNDGKPNSVDMMAIIPILVRAIQEQQAQIEALRPKPYKYDPQRAGQFSITPQ